MGTCQVNGGGGDGGNMLFTKMPNKDFVSWNSLFVLLPRLGMKDQYLHYCALKLGCPLVPVAFDSFSASCYAVNGDGGSGDGGGVGSNNGGGGGYCDMSYYSSMLFTKMPNKDFVSWNSLVSGFSKIGHFDRCISLISMMKSKFALELNELTLLFVISVCASAKIRDERSVSSLLCIEVRYAS
ncbi:pentatricopeptide repeat-containing protein At1g09190-like [Arachis ipaensis]|uniref:pentatricopeptide repeat-containing protein At1g09190-like n=1 Tax=Arachis ipaensis TaxID=130454 RepID=UPI000A2B79C5|nr:pentatricopeptide repeat-containing protein At1g09190-like [Arachis ipaensis]